MTLRLVITILQMVLEDGPSIYGSVLAALDELYELKDRGEATLEKIDVILKSNNVKVDLITDTYTPKSLR